MLTKKQAELLTFLKTATADTDICPSFDEMREALNLKSKSGIHRLISGLEERGYIRRLPNKARSIEILQPSTAPAIPIAAQIAQKVAAQVDVTPFSNDNDVEVPLLGQIAAGVPIEAIETADNYVAIPPGMVAKKAQYYALEVTGDSMQDAGILDGDTAVIRLTNQAENGQIVVALTHTGDVTLKRYYKNGDKVVLMPENTAYPPMEYQANQVAIQGVLSGINRNY